jgi:hypothetical protein
MPVGQRHVASVAIAATVQDQRAGCHNGAVTGRRPRLNLPGNGLGRVKGKGVEVENAHVRLVARVGHRCGGVVDLDGTVVAVLDGSGCTRRREGKGQAGNHKRNAGKDSEPRTP